VSCGLQKLSEFALSLENYENADYRTKYNGGTDDKFLLALHDEEQANRVSLIGTSKLRNSIVLDIGCGHGSFLDAIRGLAKSTIGIEPFTDLHDSLRNRSHQIFAPSEQLLQDLNGKIDIVTSFGVIEHLVDPLDHLIYAWSFVKPGGQLVLQTDNLDEILFVTDAQGFKEFFYRTAHNWYFSPGSLTQLAKSAQLQNFQVSTFQEYGFSNFVGWHKFGKPTGNDHVSILGRQFESAWKSSLEESGNGSLITLIAIKDA
jgi:2-polyprenyl-3-methyl-5-hydroxy-6-metoxy-1,4-benzoquinol methylase